MSLLKRYKNRILRHSRNSDLAGLIALLFILILIYGANYLYKYSFVITLLMLFLILNLYMVLEDILGKILRKFNVKVPRWVSAILVALTVYLSFINNK